jgi:hypothetical protein
MMVEQFVPRFLETFIDAATMLSRKQNIEIPIWLLPDLLGAQSTPLW